MAGKNYRDSALRLSLRLGAIYDWLLAVSILACWPPLLRLLQFPPPADPFLFRVSALPLPFFGALYWLVAHDTRGRAWALRLAIGIRLGGGAILGALAMAHDPPGAHVYGTAAIIDLAWGLHWLLLLRGAKENPPAQGDAGG